MTRPVTIVDYDPQWPMVFDEEKNRIIEVIGHIIATVEHIGSSAVPGLGGKPIIDVMAGVENSADANKCVQLLQTLKYEKRTPEPDEPDWFYCLSKVYQGQNMRLKNYHLHLVRFMSEHWKKHLLFRDYLRIHSKVAQEYYELKKRLAAEHGLDREGYTEAKTSFIESTVVKAMHRRT